MCSGLNYFITARSAPPLALHARHIHGCPLSIASLQPCTPSLLLHSRAGPGCCDISHVDPTPGGLPLIYSCPDRLPALPNYNLTRAVGLAKFTVSPQYFLFSQSLPLTRVKFPRHLPIIAWVSMVDPAWILSPNCMNFFPAP